MIYKGFIVAPTEDNYNVFDCEVHVPSLKITCEKHNDIQTIYKQAHYVNVLFNINAISFEAKVFKKENGFLFVDAKSLIGQDISSCPVLLENNHIKKILEEKTKKNEKAIDNLPRPMK